MTLVLTTLENNRSFTIYLELSVCLQPDYVLPKTGLDILSLSSEGVSKLS